MAVRDRRAALAALSAVSTRLGGRVHLGLREAVGETRATFRAASGPAPLPRDGSAEAAPGEARRARGSRGVALATGFEALDRALDGGLPKGRPSELLGDASSGKLSLALAALRRALESETEQAARDASPRAALIDLSGTCFPSEPWASGRLLVVRPPDAASGLRALDLLVSSAALDLVVVEASGVRAAHRLRGRRATRDLVPDPVRLRLARLARETGTAILGCADRPLFGASSALRLEIRPDALGGLEVRVPPHRGRAPEIVRLARPGWPDAARSACPPREGGSRIADGREETNERRGDASISHRVA